MAEPAKPAAKIPAEKSAAAKTPGRRYGVTLGDKTGNSLRFYVQERKGRVRSTGLHITKDGAGKKIKTRGAGASHDTFEAGEKAVNDAVAAAEKIGWAKKSAGQTRAESFTLATLPKAN